MYGDAVWRAMVEWKSGDILKTVAGPGWPVAWPRHLWRNNLAIFNIVQYLAENNPRHQLSCSLFIFAAMVLMVCLGASWRLIFGYLWLSWLVLAYLLYLAAGPKYWPNLKRNLGRVWCESRATAILAWHLRA
jgi:hypothetical protein